MRLLGFDLSQNQYFYRRLPFKTDCILRLNSRLKNARVLLHNANDMQQVGVGNGGRTEARVRGTGVWYTVLVSGPEPSRCTYQWFSNHQGQGRMCKYILAAQLQLR